MPELNVVTVDPGGVEVDVAITKPGGGSATAYTTAAGTVGLSLPATISSPTQFWLTEAGDFVFVFSKNGSEFYRETVGVSDREDSPKQINLTAGNLSPSALAAFLASASSGASVPTPTAGDAGKVVTVNGSEDGYELDTPAASTPFRLRAFIGNSMPFTGGNGGRIDLIEGSNELDFSVPAYPYNAAHFFTLKFNAPTFSAGTLTLTYAELDVFSPDGTEVIGIGRDADVAVTSGQAFTVVFDDDSEVNQIGTDLVYDNVDNLGVSTTAGGPFAVGVRLVFTATGLVA